MPRLPASDGNPAAPDAPAPDSLVTVRSPSGRRVVSIDDIRHIAACENYSEIFFADGHRELIRRTMQQWTAQLPAAQFARVHRGLIVNLDRVGFLERRTPELAALHFTAPAASALDIRRRHWPALRRRLSAWRHAHPPASRPTTKSIAVLPFANFSRTPAGEIFADGITEELINVLARVPGLHVAARTSSFHFKNHHAPVATIAAHLGVAYLVEGSVRLGGPRVRLTAQLIEASSGFHLWSGTFDHDAADILATQDQIAGQVAHQLQLTLQRAARTAPIDPETHRLVLEGRHYWNLRTPDGFALAATALTRALDRAPDFAPAHAALADLAVVRAMYRLADGAHDVADDLQRVHAAAQRALSLDPALAEPHAALGFACFHEGRLDPALAHFPRAFAANPNYATGHQFFAWTLAGAGRLAEALDVYHRAIALDPLNFINLDRHAAMLALAGRHAEALDASERAAALRPDLFVGNLAQRAPILLALGRTADALAAARAVRTHATTAPFRRNADSDAIFVLHQTGYRDEAAAHAAEVLARLPADNYLRGFVLSALGRFAEALPALAHTPSIMLPQLYWSPLWAPARPTPAFRQLLAQLGRTAELARAADTPTA